MTELTLARRIAARPSIVWEAISTPDGLREWIGPDAGPVIVAENDLRVGGRFVLRFRMLDGSEHESSGEYLVVDAPHTLAMTWQWRGEEAHGVSRLEIRLKPVEHGTELTLIHSKLPDEATRDSHREGWNGSLDKLEAALAARTGGTS